MFRTTVPAIVFSALLALACSDTNTRDGAAAARADDADAGDTPDSEFDASLDEDSSADADSAEVDVPGVDAEEGGAAEEDASEERPRACVEDCANGVDDCGNGLVDCQDPDCVFSAACTEEPPGGVDPDGNELTECRQYFGCTATCAAGDAGATCRAVCAESLTAEAWSDLESWDECRFSKCDSDEDGFADSTACMVLSSFLACGDPASAGTCADWYTEGGAQTCVDLMACTTACREPGDKGCLVSCLADTPPETFSAVAPVYRCILEECGTSDSDLSSTCVLAAIAGPCSSVSEPCSTALADAYLRLMNLAPGGEALDAFVGDAETPILAAIQYGESSSYTEVPAGFTTIAIAAAARGSVDDRLTDSAAELAGDSSYTLVALPTLDSVARPTLQTWLLTDDRAESVGDGLIHLRVAHADSTVGAVGLWDLTGDEPVSLDESLGYAAATPYQPLAAGTPLTLGVDTNGDAAVDLVAELSPLSNGTVLTAYIAPIDVFATGMGLFAQFEGGTVAAFPLKPHEAE